MIVLRPTELRIDEWYIRIYILWMNLLTQIIGPFILLIVLNVRTYNKIKDFERTLNDTLRIRDAIQCCRYISLEAFFFDICMYVSA